MTITKSALLLSTLVLTLVPFNVQAEDAHAGHQKTEAKDVYAPAMDKMHKDMMAVKPTGNADMDFVQGMIPHHQGALDMAEMVVKTTKDPVIKQLADNIIQAQKAEIKIMNDWLEAQKEKKSQKTN